MHDCSASSLFCCCCTFLVFLKPAINPTLHLRLHITMPHLNVIYNTQTTRLDLKLTLLCIDNKVHRCGSQRRQRTPWKCTAPLPPARHGSQDEVIMINSMQLEPGGSQGTCSKFCQRDIAKRAKTDWPWKDKLVAEFREDLRKLTRPTRRVLLPPPGLEYEEVIHQIMFRGKKGWKTRHEPSLPVLIMELTRSRL